MPCLQKLLAGLMLFCVSAAYSIATMEQAKVGKIEGFVGLADVEPTGDYLTSTFCYCEFAPKIEEFAGHGHYYQLEYYNFHLNYTFILTSTCPKDNQESGVHCLPDPEDNLLAGNSVGYELCRTWPGDRMILDDESHHDDKLCYKPRKHHAIDYLVFNKQKRNLGQQGDQGPFWRDQMGSDQVCEGLCRDRMDAALLKNHRYVPSHQVVWTHMEYVHF